MIEQSTDATKDHRVKQWFVLGCRDSSEGLLTGAEGTQKQVYLSPKPTPAQVTDISQELGNLKQAAQPMGSSTGWNLSSPGGSVDQLV